MNKVSKKRVCDWQTGTTEKIKKGNGWKRRNAGGGNLRGGAGTTMIERSHRECLKTGGNTLTNECWLNKLNNKLKMLALLF